MPDRLPSSTRVHIRKYACHHHRSFPNRVSSIYTLSSFFSRFFTTASSFVDDKDNDLKDYPYKYLTNS